MLKKVFSLAMLCALSYTPLQTVKPQEKVFFEDASLQQIEERVEACYAQEIIMLETNMVVDAIYALGKPDEKYAMILPHGEVTLRMSRPLYSLCLYTDGRIVAKEGTDYSVAVFVPYENDKGGLEYAWHIVTPTMIKGGLELPVSPQIVVDTLKITNLDKDKILYLDGIIGYCYGKEEKKEK